MYNGQILQNLSNIVTSSFEVKLCDIREPFYIKLWFLMKISILRALHHLSHLKALVEECGEKRSQKYEEKDEDEGRYSSSSTDGVTCSQQKSS